MAVCPRSGEAGEKTRRLLRRISVSVVVSQANRGLLETGLCVERRLIGTATGEIKHSSVGEEGSRPPVRTVKTTAAVEMKAIQLSLSALKDQTQYQTLSDLMEGGEQTSFFSKS